MRGLAPRGRPLAAAFAVVCVAAVGLQFLRRDIPHPPVTAEIQAPEQVRQILRASCYNCHSNETRLSWFDQIVPAQWKVASDVEQARRHINFSEIGKLPPAAQRSALFEAVNQIQYDAMPLPSYRLAHPGAAVTPEDLAILRAYLSEPEPAIANYKDSANPATVPSGAPPETVRPSPNGIEFLPGYKDWKTVSSTDRFDNNTVREILGNDVAMRAIAQNHIDPWPDGTAFAKVAWAKELDDQGIAHAGKFLQVEFMIRDSTRYAASRNWGFARWRGTDLKPYGKDSALAKECMGCHDPLRRSDYVFTMPIKGQQ